MLLYLLQRNLLTFVDDLIKVVELKLLQEQSSQEIAENAGKIYCSTTRQEVVRINERNKEF